MFKTRKQVLKIGDKYAVRFKKWHSISWSYIDNTDNHVWGYHNGVINGFALYSSIDRANNKLARYFADIKVIKRL